MAKQSSSHMDRVLSGRHSAGGSRSGGRIRVGSAVPYCSSTRLRLVTGSVSLVPRSDWFRAVPRSGEEVRGQAASQPARLQSVPVGLFPRFSAETWQLRTGYPCGSIFYRKRTLSSIFRVRSFVDRSNVAHACHVCAFT